MKNFKIVQWSKDILTYQFYGILLLHLHLICLKRIILKIGALITTIKLISQE